MPPPSQSDAPRELVRRFAAMLESGDLDEFDALVHPHFRLLNPRLAAAMNQAEVRRAIEELAACFAARRYDVQEVLVDGDRAAVRYTVSGTQRADYHGIKSRGRRFQIAAVSIYEVVDGRIAQEWELVDRQSLVEQLTA